MAQWETAIERLKAAYKAWHDSKGRSVETWVDLLADTIDFRSLADGRLGMPWTKTRRSPSEVREYLRGLTSTFEMEHYTIDRLVCQDDTIVVICSTGWRGKATGKSFDTPKVDVWRGGGTGESQHRPFFHGTVRLSAVDKTAAAARCSGRLAGALLRPCNRISAEHGSGA